MKLNKRCEICGKNKLFFLVKRRNITISEIGVPMYKDNVCNKCIKLAKKYFVKPR